MAQFNAGGAYGGSAHLQALQNSQDAFAHQLAEASTGIRAQNADAMREAWNQQLSRQQYGLDANYGMWQDMMNDPYKKFGLLNDALRSIMGGTSSTTGPNPNYTSASQNAATYAALIASMFGD
jgi:hypothetical protein